MNTTRHKKVTSPERRLLLAQVRRRTGNLPVQPTVVADLKALRARKISPMVHGLFEESEWADVFRSLERSVAFLHADNIEPMLLEVASDQTAGKLANLYLGSRGLRTATEATGCSDGERCYLTTDYFWHKNPFADFLVYDCAHALCRRLALAEAQREIFALACEAYSRVLELGSTVNDRLQLVDEMSGDGMFGPVADLVGEAVRATDGWRALLRARRSAAGEEVLTSARATG